MHSTADYGSAGVPAFLHKLWSLVEDEDTNDLIAWDPSGRSFHVFDQSRFSKEVLPLYFKHNNIASFIRQLNMYGFRKVSSVDQGGLKIEMDDMEFTHPYFQRGQELLLEHIKRKVSNPKEELKVKNNDVGRMLKDVHSLKDQQDDITNKMETLERENEALWREMATMRQKHHKQQQIVNKLIQFLITLVGNRGLGTMNRKRPLMINDASQLDDPRPAKAARQYAYDSNPTMQVLPVSESPPLQVQSPPGVRIEEMIDSPPPISIKVEPSPAVHAVPTKAPPTYIVINSARPVQSKNQPQKTPAQTSLTHRLVPLSTKSTFSNPSAPSTLRAASVIPSVSLLPSSSAIPKVPTTTGAQYTSNILQPSSNLGTSISLGDILQPDGTINSEQLDMLASEVQSNEIEPISSEEPTTSNTTTTVALKDYNMLPNSNVRDLSGDLDQMQDSLNGIKDLLSLDATGGIQGLRLESDILSGLFTPEAPLPATPEPWLNMMDSSKPDFLSASSSSGKDLVQYNPMTDDIHSLFDLGIDNFDNMEELEDNDELAALGLASSLSPPNLDLASPLAQRRKKKSQNLTMEEVD